MGKTSYITMDGMLMGEMTSGVMRNYGTDALGSVVETVLNGVEENTYHYKPYGGLLAKTGVAADPSFLWNGGSGYRVTNLINTDVYVRRRHLSLIVSRWTSVDPIWPNRAAYDYVDGYPINISDRSGLGSGIGGSPITGCVCCPRKVTYKWKQCTTDPNKYTSPKYEECKAKYMAPFPQVGHAFFGWNVEITLAFDLIKASGDQIPGPCNVSTFEHVSGQRGKGLPTEKDNPNGLWDTSTSAKGYNDCTDSIFNGNTRCNVGTTCVTFDVPGRPAPSLTDASDFPFGFKLHQELTFTSSDPRVCPKVSNSFDLEMKWTEPNQVVPAIWTPNSST